MGELVSAADTEQLEDDTLSYEGYLVSTFTEFLRSVQETKKQVTHSELDRAEVSNEH